MKIEIYEIESKENKVYKELMDKYNNDDKVKPFLDFLIFDSPMILAGDFRLITMMNDAIEMKNIKVYLLKDIDTDSFLWAIGKFDNSDKIEIYPLSLDQSKEMLALVRKILIEKGIIKE